MLTSEGYPGSYVTGIPIHGLNQVSSSDEVSIFHAGTKREGETFLTAGGRVLGVMSLGSSLSVARDRVYQVIPQVSFQGCHYRLDIAQRALDTHRYGESLSTQ